MACVTDLTMQAEASSSSTTVCGMASRSQISSFPGMMVAKLLLLYWQVKVGTHPINLVSDRAQVCVDHGLQHLPVSFQTLGASKVPFHRHALAQALCARTLSEQQSRLEPLAHSR